MQTESDSRPDRFRRQAIQPEEAQALIQNRVGALPAEKLQLAEAWGRTLAEPLVAPHPFPPFRRSGMDGYAVRSADLREATSEHPLLLDVVESLPSGVAPKREIGSGQAARIMTGGMVPTGADAVVILEATRQVENGRVHIGKPALPGQHISEIGSEIAQGETLLPAGTVIQAGETALLAACGYAFVSVAKRPRIAILSTGSELLGIEDSLAPAKIRNSNLPMLAALIREAGAEPIVLGNVPDDLRKTEKLIRDALPDCDLLLTTGGVSVGDYDVMVDVLGSPDAEKLFDKIAMRPGSPTSAAIMDGKLLLALSGNPGACFVGFHLFAKPAIRRMLGAKQLQAARIEAYLDEPFTKVNAFKRFIRGRLRYDEGKVFVAPTGEDKSSLMTTIVGADCLIEIPPLKTALDAGQLVTVWKL